MTEQLSSGEQLPIANTDSAPSPDYRERAKAAHISLDFVKRHQFSSNWKGSIFEDFDHARSTVRGRLEALVVVDGSLRGALALDRNAIDKVFPELVEAFDALTGMKREKDQGFDPDRDLVVLFGSGPFPQYHGLEVRGFLVWRVAGTCHFRQYPAPSDSNAEKRAFGSRGE
jgi:hypothetical protein